MLYFGILYDRIPLMSTHVDSTDIYWYTQKALGTTLLTLKKYLLIYLCFFVVFFTVNNQHIHKCFSKSLYLIYYSIYFFGDYECSFIS